MKFTIKAIVEKAKSWYYDDYNFLRVVKFPHTNVPILDIIIDFFKLFTKGRTIDRAAGVAFNFILALFPMILFVFTLIPYIPIPHLYERLMHTLESFIIPSGTLSFVEDTINGIMNQPHEGLLSISIIMSLFFGSSGIVAIFNGFQNVYSKDTIETKTGLLDWVYQRLYAILMLILIGVLVIVSIILISLGGWGLHYLVEIGWLERGGTTFVIFNILRWLISIFAIMTVFSLLYYFGNLSTNTVYRVNISINPFSDKKYKRFVMFNPGCLLATGLFILSTIGFNIYISNFASYNALYGSIGTLIIIMMWIWIMAITILTGNDLNTSIRQRADVFREKEKQ